jgi:hypothetical protein
MDLPDSVKSGERAAECMKQSDFGCVVKEMSGINSKDGQQDFIDAMARKLTTNAEKILPDFEITDHHNSSFEDNGTNTKDTFGWSEHADSIKKTGDKGMTVSITQIDETHSKLTATNDDPGMLDKLLGKSTTAEAVAPKPVEQPKEAGNTAKFAEQQARDKQRIEDQTK